MRTSTTALEQTPLPKKPPPPPESSTKSVQKKSNVRRPSKERRVKKTSRRNNTSRRTASLPRFDHNGTVSFSNNRCDWKPIEGIFMAAIVALREKNIKVTPANLRYCMNVSGLTREQVSSHLQKFLIRVSKEDEEDEGSSPNQCTGSTA